MILVNFVYLGLFCPDLTFPLLFGVLVAGDPFEQLIEFGGLAGLFGLIYALYSLVVEFNLFAIEIFPFVGLVTCC